MTKKDIHALFSIFQELNPHPKSDLNFTDDFSLLVSVVLSAQTSDKRVNMVTPALFKAAPTPKKMAALGPEKIGDFIKSLGLYNAKAKSVYLLSQKIMDDFGGKVPDKHADLITLPGVGRKSANVVMNVAHGAPLIAVDTHVFRISHRLGLSDGQTVEAVNDDLDRIVPDEFKSRAGHWLVLHGRYICVARSPKCDICPVRHLCPTGQAMLP